ncbi:protein transport protein Sec61 subunit alpha-like [Dermatophagoides farinae]|uniref:protein transport protein Sec61 subunit alpha-like n=1 Tax=Dermatophagoides farinae TaxID=6954 RepID=UPI003F5E51D2
MDEVEAMTTTAQQSLRRIYEIYADTTRYFMICNSSEKIIEPLQSRSIILRFSKIKNDAILNRLKKICDAQNYNYSEDALALLVDSCEGDCRKAIGYVQMAASLYDKLEIENVYNICDILPLPLIKELFLHIQEGKFKQANTATGKILDEGYSNQEILASLLKIIETDDMSNSMKMIYHGMITESIIANETGISDLQFELNFIVVRVLDIIKPLSGILPSIRTPKRPVSGNEKVFWTLVCLFIFLVCSQIPIFGVTMNSSADPFYWARVMLASNKGSLMELGISPIMTASMIMHFLVGLKAIACDMSLSEDRELYNDAQKWLSLVICFGTSIAYVLSGAFGKISLFVSVIIITQLLTSGVIVMLMDDLLTKGYGFGGGVSMFITTSICEKLVWSMFSPTTLHTKNGTEFEGAFVALMHFLIRI